MCGINDQKVAIVIFPSLPMGLESTFQSASQACRLSAFWARVNSKPIASATTLRQCHDCYRDLDQTDRKQSSPDKSARFNILMEREMPRDAQPSGGGACAVPIVVGNCGTTEARDAGPARKLSGDRVRLRSRFRLREDHVFSLLNLDPSLNLSEG